MFWGDELSLRWLGGALALLGVLIISLENRRRKSRSRVVTALLWKRHGYAQFTANELTASCIILQLPYDMADCEAALARLCDAATKVSAHYLIRRDGHIFQLVDEAARAWHAGVSFWQGETDMNSASIGIELDHDGHKDGKMDAFPEAQMAALLKLLQEVTARHAIAPQNILGHSDIAPGRKIDPGEAFDWAALHQAGFGLWLDNVTIQDIFAAVFRR